METIDKITSEEDRLRFDKVISEIKVSSSYQDLNKMFGDRLNVTIERMKTESGFEYIMYEVKYVSDESTSHQVHVGTMDVPCDELFTFRLNCELHTYIRIALNTLRSYNIHKIIMERDALL